MDKVDEALDAIEKYIEDGSPLPSTKSPYWEASESVPIVRSELARLRAERDELRAMLEPTPDARELALALAEGVWERNTLYVGARNHWLSEAAQLIYAHDARLLDEAAERGVAWLIEQTSHIDPALAATNSGKWLIKLREKQTAELRAAIIGEEE